MSTTISINETTREHLKMLGRKGETYDEIIKALIEVAKMHGFLEEQKWVLSHQKFYRAEDL
ncbi:hypothetical protein KAW38_04290 [Candidatus Micrarchaeota archaeon]|nr:hypothetical protein [Candidatus Micrarchaeota archaeon]